MDNKIERLQKFDNHKLVDVVKNYRQYGYDDEIRNAAIAILESRDVKMDDLKLRGDFDNKAYDDAEYFYHAFEKQSKTAFVFYGLVIVSRVVLSSLSDHDVALSLIFLFTFLISLVVYVVSVIKSFISQSKYYKLIGRTESQLNPGLYFTVGMSLYIVMYFVFKKQMKDEMKSIR